MRPWLSLCSWGHITLQYAENEGTINYQSGPLKVLTVTFACRPKRQGKSINHSHTNGTQQLVLLETSLLESLTAASTKAQGLAQCKANCILPLTSA